jgi:tetratricopeptide (TPR) repeat protein
VDGAAPGRRPACLCAGLEGAQEDGDSRAEAVFSSNLALVENALGSFEAAYARARHALAIDRAQGRWSGVCNGLNNLANWLRRDRRFDEAETAALECLRLSHEHGLDGLRPFALIGLALLHHATGRAGAAEQTLDLIDSTAPESLEGPVRAGAAQLRARIALDRGQGTAALQQVARALRICIDTDDRANRAEALVLYGQWLAQHGGRPAEARRLWSALRAVPALEAALHEQLQGLLGALPPLEATGPMADSELALLAEQALAEALRQAAG